MTDTQTPTAKVGNLTRDPELKVSAKGTAFATYGLAVKPYVAKGEPEPETTFYEVVCFGSLAEHVAECMAQGDRAVVVGKGELDRWTGKDGAERVTKKIVADAIGPDLRFTTVEIQRTERREPVSVGAGDRPDEEPF
jgi:single-strand DNA-binding protein